MRIRDFMSTNVVTVNEKTSIHDAKKIMDAHKIRRLPVMKKDKLVGLGNQAYAFGGIAFACYLSEHP